MSGYIMSDLPFERKVYYSCIVQSLFAECCLRYPCFLQKGSGKDLQMFSLSTHYFRSTFNNLLYIFGLEKSII